MKAAAPEHDSDGFIKFDGFVRMPCTGPGCDVTAYQPVETDPAVALCHACKCAAERTVKENSMAAKKKGNGATARAREVVKGDAVERQKFHERLPCKIDQGDVQKNSAELAKLIRERKQTLEHKRDVNADFRKKVAFYDERLDELGESVEGGTEMRSVECVERFTARTNTVDVVRLDTGEVVRSRAGTAEDRQEEFSLDEKQDDASEGGDEATV